MIIFYYRNAQVEVKNKKGNSPLWLAANGGHLAVVELLYSVGADIDSQDNRKVSFGLFFYNTNKCSFMSECCFILSPKGSFSTLFNLIS